jgi:hypothetical protein
VRNLKKKEKSKKKASILTCGKRPGFKGGGLVTSFEVMGTKVVT